MDVVYNAQMSRVYVPSRTYIGERNPNTGATGAYVLGSGGATFNKQVSGTIVQGDEIYGSQSFEFYVFAGITSAPSGSGNIAELDSLAAHLTDQIPPQVASATYFPVSRQLSITFTETVKRSPVTFTGIAIDQNNDGVAEVTLDNSTVVTNLVDSPTLVLTVSSSVGAAISALNHNTLRLLMAAGSVRDIHLNAIAQVRNTDNKLVSFGAPTAITIDGFINMSEWTQCAVAVRDSNDSQWNSGPGQHNNEIQSLLMSMDSTYLYLAIAGRVDHNSWLLYLDTDPGGAGGQADLRNIDTWDREAQFTAPGFKADWEYGCFQDQGAFDSNGLWKILSATTTGDSSSKVLLAFDSGHIYGDNGGSELAIPWSVLYGLGVGRVPANARIAMVASLAYNGCCGQLGGDVAPNPAGAPALPTIDKAYTFTVDANGDGYPDLPDHLAPALVSAAASNDTTVIVTLSEVVDPVSAGNASNYSIYRTSTPAQTVTVKSAVRIGGGTQVALTTAHQIYQDYTVQVSAVKDTACIPNTIPANSNVTFAGAPVGVDGPRKPAEFALLQNTPNPFGRGTVIRYQVPAAGAGRPLNLSVFDSGGRKVRTLKDGPAQSGALFAEWDGRDDSGARVGAGVYFYRLSSGAEKLIRKLVVLR